MNAPRLKPIELHFALTLDIRCGADLAVFDPFDSRTWRAAARRCEGGGVPFWEAHIQILSGAWRQPASAPPPLATMSAPKKWEATLAEVLRFGARPGDLQSLALKHRLRAARAGFRAPILTARRVEASLTAALDEARRSALPAEIASAQTARNTATAARV